MGPLTGITGTLADRCECITQPHIKKLTRKVELSNLLSETVVYYSQEAKYSGYRSSMAIS